MQPVIRDHIYLFGVCNNSMVFELNDSFQSQEHIFSFSLYYYRNIILALINWSYRKNHILSKINGKLINHLVPNNIINKKESFLNLARKKHVNLKYYDLKANPIRIIYQHNKEIIHF